jgi:hypothetical protein
MERVDWDGTVDDVCEGVFRMPPPPPTPARPESHMSKGQVGPSRRARGDQLGCSSPRSNRSMLRIVETSHTLFLISCVQLVFTSMNWTVLLLSLERLGLVDSWHISYDQKGTLEGLITGAPEDNNR